MGGLIEPGRAEAISCYPPCVHATPLAAGESPNRIVVEGAFLSFLLAGVLRQADFAGSECLTQHVSLSSGSDKSFSHYRGRVEKGGGSIGDSES